MEMKKQVSIYTDGACKGNPGPGGYGAVLIYGEKRKELAGGFRLTTNNRMEIIAAIKGLKALKYSCMVTLYTDSKYLANAIEEGWALNWRSNGWKKKDKKPASNIDLWEELLLLLEQHQVSVQWVKGHSNVPENEHCDHLATEFAQRNDLPEDAGYCSL